MRKYPQPGASPKVNLSKGDSAMSSNWVDFKELRSRLRFADVLQSYSVELKVKGDRATGLCPLPGHPRHDGKRRSPSFSANLSRGLFNCFGCQAKGNIIDFVCFMSGGDPRDSTALHNAALELQKRFPGTTGERDQKPADSKSSASPTAAKSHQSKSSGEAQEKPSEVEARSVIVNAPLDFTLKMLDSEHPYLKQRGLTPETISHFELGYCSRGMMQGRIVIPLHDPQGQLIGYAGRLIDDSKVSDEQPKYRFPGTRERNGVRYEFQKSQFLFNGHRIKAPVDDLIIVEGFMSVFWLVQYGYRNVVALMGSSASKDQIVFITELVSETGRVWIFLDGDEAGERCAVHLFTQIATCRAVRWLKLDMGHQPTGCAPETLLQLLSG
jgi:DNA primase